MELKTPGTCVKAVLQNVDVDAAVMKEKVSTLFDVLKRELVSVVLETESPVSHSFRDCIRHLAQL